MTFFLEIFLILLCIVVLSTFIDRNNTNDDHDPEFLPRSSRPFRRSSNQRLRKLIDAPYDTHSTDDHGLRRGEALEGGRIFRLHRFRR